MPVTSAQLERIRATAQDRLRECTRLIVFDGNCNILHSTFQVGNPAELRNLMAALGPRDDAIRRGMTLQGQRYEVHRHHPPLVYGRLHGTDPEHSTGAAVCETKQSIAGEPLYTFITYELPNVSARMVALLREWAEDEIALPQPA